MKKLRAKKIKELKKEALNRLKELNRWQDDCFLNVKLNDPLDNDVVCGILSDMLEEAEYAEFEGILKEEDVKRLDKWFMSICRDYLIDRFSKIDWEAQERARKRLQETLERHLGIKKKAE